MNCVCVMFIFFFSSRRRHTRYWRDWSSDVCSSDLHWCTAPARVAVSSGAELSDGSGATPPALGALAGGCNDLPQRSALTLDHRWRSPNLLGWAHCRLYLDPHPVKVGKQGSVLLPDRPVRPRLLVQELGKPVAVTVQLQEPLVNFPSCGVLGFGARCHHRHVDRKSTRL